MSDGLRLEGVSVAYKHATAALDGVSLAVPDGARVALLGANGAGKTTVVRAVSGMLRFFDARATGRVTFDGADITNARSDHTVRRGITQVPEGRQMFPRMTVEENLLLGALTRKSRKAIAQDVDMALDFFPALQRRRRAKAGLLSGGEQQMVAMARAIMARPRLFVIDELTLGLSPVVIEDLVARLEEVLEATEASLLLVEQNARLALELCSRAYVLDRGQVVREGTSAELIADPRIHDAYLGIARDPAELEAPA